MEVLKDVILKKSLELVGIGYIGTYVRAKKGCESVIRWSEDCLFSVAPTQQDVTRHTCEVSSVQLCQ